MKYGQTCTSWLWELPDFPGNSPEGNAWLGWEGHILPQASTGHFWPWPGNGGTPRMKSGTFLWIQGFWDLPRTFHPKIHLWEYHRTLWRCQVTDPHLWNGTGKREQQCSPKRAEGGDEVKCAPKGWRWGQGSRECVQGGSSTAGQAALGEAPCCSISSSFLSLFIYSLSASMNSQTDNEAGNPSLGWKSCWGRDIPLP